MPIPWPARPIGSVVPTPFDGRSGGGLIVGGGEGGGSYLLPYPGPAGSQNTGNRLPANWAQYVGKPCGASNFGSAIDLTGSALTPWHGDIVVASDGTFSVANNVWGQNDGLGALSGLVTSTPNYLGTGRTYVVINNLRLIGKLRGGGSGGTKPGIVWTNLKVEPVNAPALSDTSNLSNDTSYIPTNGGYRGLRTTLAADFVAASGVMNVDGGVDGFGGIVPGVTGYIGAAGSLPDDFQFTAIEPVSGGLTMQLTGVTGAADAPKGTQVKFGVERTSGRIDLQDVVWGQSTKLWMWYGGDNYADQPCVDWNGACRPETAGDVMLDGFLLSNFSTDGMRWGHEGHLNGRIVRGTGYMNPNAYAFPNTHGDMFRVKSMDNSALNAQTQPFAEWVFLAHVKGNAGFYINTPPNQGLGLIKNVGIKHCLGSCVNKFLSLSGQSEATGTYMGYCWTAFNSDYADTIDIRTGADPTDLTWVEVRADDSNHSIRCAQGGSPCSAQGPPG